MCTTASVKLPEAPEQHGWFVVSPVYRLHTRRFVTESPEEKRV